ncbi:hypothetical protein L1277_002708 [Okibacterium sp. HSC-33S16]|nr:hypothetical protein [Okibacterium sp. HSC-33S16]
MRKRPDDLADGGDPNWAYPGVAPTNDRDCSANSERVPLGSTSIDLVRLTFACLGAIAAGAEFPNPLVLLRAPRSLYVVTPAKKSRMGCGVASPRLRGRHRVQDAQERLCCLVAKAWYYDSDLQTGPLGKCLTWRHY